MSAESYFLLQLRPSEDAPLLQAASELSAKTLPAYPLAWEPEECRVYAAVTDLDTLLGFVGAIVHEKSRTADIASVVVNPDSRNQGVGLMLLSFAAKALKDEGLTRAAVVPITPESRSLCRRAGFEGRGETKYIDLGASPA